MPLKPRDARLTTARAIGRRRSDRSRLEWVLAAILVIVFIAVFITRIMPLFVQVERTRLTQVHSQLRAALGLAVAQRVAQGKTASLHTLAHTNPVSLLATPPDNYLGALNHPTPQSIAPGAWYYNTQRHWLVYRVRHTDAFIGGLRHPARAAFEIVLRYSDPKPTSRPWTHHRAPRTVQGVVLRPVAAFHWRGQHHASGHRHEQTTRLGSR